MKDYAIACPNKMLPAFITNINNHFAIKTDKKHPTILA
jgi:hypothetical protein